MRRPATTILALLAVTAFLAAVVVLGLWVGRFAARNIAAPPRPVAVQPATPRAPEIAPAPAGIPPPPLPPAPRFANVLPYAPTAPLAEIGPFRLTDQDRTGINNSSLRGHYSLVFFGYTNCVQICAYTLENIELALFELGVSAEAVTAYFISVDPRRDSREVMARYISGLHQQIRGLTGTEEQIEAAIAAFGVTRVVHAPADGAPADDYIVEHPGVLFLLDRMGRYKLHMPEGTPAFEIARIIRANW